MDFAARATAEQVAPTTVGEQHARGRRRQRPRVQRKLTVGAANDPLEREADRIADEVMRTLGRGGGDAAVFAGSSSTRITRHAGHDHHRDERHAHPEVGMAGGDISPALAGEIARSSGGRPLPARTLARMERGFGASFEHVRIHPDSELPRKVAADAFTFGSHVHFAPGRFDPGTRAGERLLAHELTHVVQQGHAVARHVCGPGCGADRDGIVGEEWPARRSGSANSPERGGSADADARGRSA